MQAGTSVVCRTKGPFLSTHNRFAAMDGMVENNMAKSAMMTMKDYLIHSCSSTGQVTLLLSI